MGLSGTMGLINTQKSIRYSHELLIFICLLGIFPFLLISLSLIHCSKTEFIQQYVTEISARRLKPEIPLHLGLMVKDITAETARKLHLKSSEGMLITKVIPSGRAESAGLQAKDIIQQVNKRKIGSTQDFRRAINEAAPEGSFEFLVGRREVRLNVNLNCKS